MSRHNLPEVYSLSDSTRSLATSQEDDEPLHLTLWTTSWANLNSSVIINDAAKRTSFLIMQLAPHITGASSN